MSIVGKATVGSSAGITALSEMVTERLRDIHCMTCPAVEPPYSECNCPQGKLCHEAADLIEAKERECDACRAELGEARELLGDAGAQLVLVGLEGGTICELIRAFLAKHTQEVGP